MICYSSVARDFVQNSFMTAKCHSRHIAPLRAGMKIILRYPRALNSGWLPTNPPHVNERFSCHSDLGTIGLHYSTEFPSVFLELEHGQSYSILIDPTIVNNDKQVRNIDAKM